MRRKNTGCFGGQCFYDPEDEDTDEDIQGYYPLESVGDVGSNLAARDGGAEDADENDYFKSVDSYQQRTSASSSPLREAPSSYTDVDVKGKRLRKKMRRKQVRKRIGHVLHSSWKWFKRGLTAVAPSMGAMFMFSPSAAPNVIASEAARRQAARDSSRRHPVFL